MKSFKALDGHSTHGEFSLYIILLYFLLIQIEVPQFLRCLVRSVLVSGVRLSAWTGSRPALSP